MGESFKFFKTRNGGDPGLAVDVQMSWLTPSALPGVGAPLGDCADMIKRRVPEAWWSYKFCEVEAAGVGFCTFKFCSPKTSVERNTAFVEFETYREHAWPNVLFDIRFVLDERFPRAAGYAAANKAGKVYAPTIYTRKFWREGVVVDSRCLVQRYLSDTTPFSEAELQHIQPDPGLVEWDFNGAQGSLNCLHPDIRIKSHGLPYTTLYDGATGNMKPPPIPERFFPATFFEDWAPFVISDSQVEEGGVWFREKVTIYPPPFNDPVIE